MMRICIDILYLCDYDINLCMHELKIKYHQNMKKKKFTIIYEKFMYHVLLYTQETLLKD